MAFCIKCGTQIADGAKFCPSCGAEQVAPTNAEPNNAGSTNTGAQGGPTDTTSSIGKVFTNTKDTTNEYAPEDIEKGKVMSILAYFGVLFFLPLVVCPDSKYGRFHANQGLLLLIFGGALTIIEIILSVIITAIFGESFYGVTLYISGFGKFLLAIVGIICYVPTAVLFIVGLVNSIGGKAKELPFIGKFRIIK